MATICKKCHGIVGDIYPPGEYHKCGGSETYQPYRYPIPQPSPLNPLPMQAQKCDICGSTAIDHTEMQCQINRMKGHDHSQMQKIGCKDCYNDLSADLEGFLIFRKKYYVVYVSHPSQLYQGDRPYNDRQRKKHLALSLEGKSLCNMIVQTGDKKLAWNSPMQYVQEPDHGAGETCKICWDKIQSEEH